MFQERKMQLSAIIYFPAWFNLADDKLWLVPDFNWTNLINVKHLEMFTEKNKSFIFSTVPCKIRDENDILTWLHTNVFGSL